jgi:hypothetical protein
MPVAQAPPKLRLAGLEVSRCKHLRTSGEGSYRFGSR